MDLEKEKEEKALNKRLFLQEKLFSTKDLLHFANLVELELHSSQFEASSGVFFPNLTILTLSFKNPTSLKGIDFLPNIFPNIKSLKLKSVGNAKDLMPHISLFSSLEKLIIEGCRLNEFPKEITSLFQLKSLSLKSNFIKEIPSSIVKMKRLDTLDLEANHLQRIAPDITKLLVLRTLLLKQNKLKSIPKLEKLERLMELDLSENKLASIPSTIFRCKQIVYLYLSNNPMKKFGVQVQIMPALRRLILVNCGFKNIPKKLAHFENLRHLDLSQNRLTSFPLFFHQLPHLDYLFLSNNLISKLPIQLGKLDKIRHLNLDGNKLSELPWSIFKLKKLLVFDLERNSFNQFPVPVLSLSSTTHTKGLSNKRFHNYFKRKIYGLKFLSPSLINMAFEFIKFGKPSKRIAWKNLGQILEIDLPLLSIKTTKFAVELYHKRQKIIPLTTDSKLYLIGELNTNKENLDNILSQQNIEWAADIKSANYIILGQKVSYEEFGELKKKRYNLLTESNLYSELFRLSPPFLLGEENDDLRKNIVDLFQSEAAENKTIAIHSMYNGGVPQVLKTELIISATSRKKFEGLQLAKEICWMYLTDLELDTALYFWGFWQDKYVFPDNISLDFLSSICIKSNLDFELLNAYYEKHKKEDILPF